MLTRGPLEGILEIVLWYPLPQAFLPKRRVALLCMKFQWILCLVTLCREHEKDILAWEGIKNGVSRHIPELEAESEVLLLHH